LLQLEPTSQFVSPTPSSWGMPKNVPLCTLQAAVAFTPSPYQPPTQPQRLKNPGQPPNITTKRLKQTGKSKHNSSSSHDSDLDR
jgi:hypothetical protein